MMRRTLAVVLGSMLLAAPAALAQGDHGRGHMRGRGEPVDGKPVQVRPVDQRTELTAFAVPETGAADEACIVSGDPDGTQCYTLYGGQTIDSGTVCLTVNGQNLDVTFSTTGGWELVETHLWVGSDVADMPQTRKGNPIPGQFPYVSGDITGSTVFTSSVPLASIGFECPGDDRSSFLAAHAALRRDNGDGSFQTETGWSDGGSISDGGSWATLSTTTLGCDCATSLHESIGGCETAFAHFAAANTCFLEIDEDGDAVGDFSRWGWTNGPLATGSYSFDIYAGAGRCDLGKGTLVGTLTVDYDGAYAAVSFDLDAPYTLEETHLYVGNEILARNAQGFFTVAPGQYPDMHEDLGNASYDSYEVSVSGDVHVVAHAVVCGF